MALVKMKPTSPGRRGMVKVVTEGLFKGRPFAALLEKKTKTSGRNNNGHITTVISVVVTSIITVLLTSNATKTVFLLKLNVSNTILTVLRTLHCCATQTVSVSTSSLLRAFPLAIS